jgi:hypothetical protein
MAKAPSPGPRSSTPPRPRRPGRTPTTPATPERGDGRVPLERALSKLGLASRAEARRLILAGRATVGGAGGLELGRLAPGEHRTVPAAELAAVFPGAPLRMNRAR